MVVGSLGGSARKSNRLRRAYSMLAVSPSRIAQSGYNAQTIVPNRTSSADSAGPLVLGVDIGGTAIKAAIVGTSGDFLESFQAPSPRSVSALHDFVHSILKSTKGPVRGIGIGCKGIIDTATSRVNSLPGDLHFLEGSLLSDVIAADNLPVFADNDARSRVNRGSAVGCRSRKTECRHADPWYRGGWRGAGGWRDASRRSRGRGTSRSRDARSTRRSLHLRELRMPGDSVFVSRH